MNNDNSYYQTLDLPRLAREIPADKERRERDEAFGEMIIALALRCHTEQFTTKDLLTLLGQPDSVQQSGAREIWEYRWRSQHCGSEYRSSTPFVL